MHELKVRVALAVPEAGTETVVVPGLPAHPLKLEAIEDEAERVTLPEKPLRPVTVIVEGQQVYWAIVIVLGLAETAKPVVTRLKVVVPESFFVAPDTVIW